MKTKIEFFSQKLFSDTHREFVFLPSIQYNHYSEVQGIYEWMNVFSIKFLIWEFGFSITKLKKQKKFNTIVSSNIDEINFSEHSTNEQYTSVPEKQIEDL
jgi:hypothetical protein